MPALPPVADASARRRAAASGYSATFSTPSRCWLKSSNASSMSSSAKRCVTSGDEIDAVVRDHRHQPAHPLLAARDRAS